MNKSFYHVALIALLGLSTFSCTKDIDIPEKPVAPPMVTEALLGVNPTIAGVEAVTRGIITAFTDNDQIGLFLTDGELGSNYQGNADASNIPAMYRGSWSVEKKIPVTTTGVTYAYYPYKKENSNCAAVPVEIASQTDYLYARKATVEKGQPVAQIGMKHALSLVSVVIIKNDYQKEGRLTKVEVLDVQGTGTMNIATGEVASSGAPTTYAVETNLLLNDNDIEKTKMIMLPTVVAQAQGDVRFQLTIDGKYYIWGIPKSHRWEAGKEYTYTLHLSKTPEETPELELDVDYWTTYGKDDNITLEDHTGMDAHYYKVVNVEMGITSNGRTVVQGEAYAFAGVVNATKQGFKGRVKYSLWQGDKMVEQFPSYRFECTFFSTVRVPCFITAAPGEYKLRMLLKEEGKNTWFLPSDRWSEERDWMFTVQANNRIPSIKSMNKEGFASSNDAIRLTKINQLFNMEYTLTNRAAIPLKGEIKAVWHRTFTGEFKLIGDSDNNEWADEIGRVKIELPADTKKHKGMLPCKIVEHRAYVKKEVPIISFYYKADGSENWQLMRSDSDAELQRWKGADKDKIVNGSEDYPDLWWGIQSGFNYQYMELE